MSDNFQIKKSFKDMLKEKNSISEQKRALLDNALIFYTIVSKTSNLSINTSPYLRLVELLHLFSTDMNAFFDEYLLLLDSDDDIGTINTDIAEVKKRFIYDIIRYNSNHNAVKKYFKTFKSYLNERSPIDYAPLINSYMHELEQIIIDSDDSIIFNYTCYKEFFSHFLTKMSILLNIEENEDPLYLFIVCMHLPKVNLSILRNDFISDLHNDYLKNNHPKSLSDSSDEFKRRILSFIKKICTYKTPINQNINNTSINFLDVFASLRENWDIINKLANKKILSDYLFKLIDNSIEITEELSTIQESLAAENPLAIIERCLNNSYLLNYIPPHKTRVKVNVIISFFKSKCDSEFDTVLFCYNKLIYFSCISKEHMKILFYYSCMLE